MQDLKKNRRRMNNKQMAMMSNIPETEVASETEATVDMDDLERGCKCEDRRDDRREDRRDDRRDKCCDDRRDKCCNDKHDKCCDDKHDKCECKKCEEKCEPCSVESDVCVVNPCRETCCNGITPTFSTRDASPIAMEVKRIFDSIQFRVFTDANGENGDPLFFDFEVIQVRGNVPAAGLARVTVDEVCINFSSMEITPGEVTVDDFDVTPIENNSNCDTVFESIVCPNRNATCCAQNRGQNVLFRERGLEVEVNDLVLEIRAHCGCTKIVALGFPSRRRNGGQLCRGNDVQFRFNTLASNLCVPSSGRSFTLRQDYRTNLAVDCISNAFISAEDCEPCDDFDCFDFTIPSGIDLILCVEETVSALIGDQVVVLANNNFEPRVVDTFANVCRFPGCGE